MSSSEQKENLLPLHAKDRPDPLTKGAPNTQNQQPQDSIRTKYAWLAIYFALNLALTLYNKAVMGK
ncbi:hypothetical protein RUND412_007429, partial [Rhizina undulata]